ncbi:DUF1800 domain-containing protein [Costertonia aggregata]|uniref:DUF1800 domain-containing protein n=1 Tax=Costertonia aggregata TaxID=343403 RepID=A0A7H9ALL1_9FLAO|nr:DUF1800 domain-containing protein [Costertonia aggregata]QLG44254.1 DUF1800 domain-containing protein [Costertonia aggregata]
MKKSHIQHLYNRAGFGILPNTINGLSGLSKARVVKALFDSSKKIDELKIATPEIDAYIAGLPEKKDPRVFRKLVKDSRRKLVLYNGMWIKRMAETKQDLRERMVLFWSNHFVVRTRNILFAQKFNNTLRKHALGDFREFVIAISKEPAMLDYLNNQQNRKNSPNENFARELMELFTLGEGNYSEKDIKESARAFTGWSHNFKGDYVLRKRQHDFGEKEFMGKTGNFDGGDIIQIILEQPQCAEFICKKIYLHFVNDTMYEPHIKELAKVFRKQYDITAVMEYIFLSDWFYEKKNIGNKIKSPADFLVGLQKTIPFTLEKPNQLIYVERLLGQVLLEPPNVAGWAEGRNWIDANTMMVRLKLPSVLYKDGTIAFDVKGEFEDDFEEFNKKNNLSRRLPATKKWSVFNENYGFLSYRDLASYILNGVMNEGTKTFLETLEKTSKQEFCIQLMSLPEYQLC